MTPRARGLGLLWLLVALCATNWVLVKDSGGLDAFTFSALRFTVAAAAFAPFLPQVCPICTRATLACRQLMCHALILLALLTGGSAAAEANSERQA